jgi:hypothetical protein
MLSCCNGRSAIDGVRLRCTCAEVRVRECSMQASFVALLSGIVHVIGYDVVVLLIERERE